MITAEATWELGNKVAGDFFKDDRVKELFQKTCELWWAYKVIRAIPLLLCERLQKGLEHEILNLLSVCYGAVPFFDTNYCERIWIQKVNFDTHALDTLFYYDCFFHQFVAFEEN